MTDPVTGLAVPSPQQAAWQEMELGLFIHFTLGTYTDYRRGPRPGWRWRSFRNYPSPDVFQPRQLDTDQWLQAAVDMGARYAVLVAKHCEGFCLWPTEAHDYSVKSSSWRGGKGDIVRDFVESCQKVGVKPGLYYSTSANSYYKVDNPGLVQSRDPQEQARYVAMVKQQLRELWSRYGELVELWFDGGTLPEDQGGIDVGPLLDELQPHAVVFQSNRASIRWVGNEDGVAPDPCWSAVGSVADVNDAVDGYGNPDGVVWCPAECDVPIRKREWFWKPGEEHLVASTDHLVDLYYRSVGHNANLLLNSNPNPDGLVPQPDFARYAEFGKNIRRRFGQPLAETSGRGAELELALPATAAVDHVALQEEIALGHRVREYVVEALAGDQWQTVSQGTAIGHKKIDRFPAVTTARLRIRVRQHVGEPVVKKFTAYAVG